MRSGYATAARYIAFAIGSAATNFLSQQAVLMAYHGFGALGLSMIVGTGVGFVVKYVLDKLYVFDDRRGALRQEAQKIGLYGMTAILTTLVFWSFELGFLAVGKTAFWKYLGGALGLCVGYALKYFLDRRWVFRAATPL